MAKLHAIGYEKIANHYALPGSGADTLMVRQQLATYEVVWDGVLYTNFNGKKLKMILF